MQKNLEKFDFRGLFVKSLQLFFNSTKSSSILNTLSFDVNHLKKNLEDLKFRFSDFDQF